ncbi:helix-turn-helix domain-containing protein [Agromyces indicus]|uniref:Helix-turn-helix transcriptional regulator n=1 Tax=Agromyces indicus TaxID=758919 RepID=A0ABU1FJM4_9MICO|nr:helix-turn-helix transcriptional regulator [Agromyces indicus]MDR5691470.1 helix-turn-helix transcriptional regulator [Agromyces indicus]
MGRLIEFPQAEPSRAARPLWRHVLGEVLRRERLDQDRILTEVAATAGVSPQYLSEVERGRKEASSEVLGAVADALGLELADVVGRVAGRLGARNPARADTGSPAPVSAPPIAGPAHDVHVPAPLPRTAHDILAPAPTPSAGVADVFLLAA